MHYEISDTGNTNNKIRLGREEASQTENGFFKTLAKKFKLQHNEMVLLLQ